MAWFLSRKGYAYLQAYSTGEQAEAAVSECPLYQHFGSLGQLYEVLEAEAGE